MIFGRGLLLSFFLFVGLTGCFGRIDDQEGSRQRLRPDSFGLSGERPAVLVFAAAWCKPCRHEIPAFNQLKSVYGDRLDVVGYMVEGLETGSLPSTDDIQSFSNASGERPDYQLQADGGWKLFDLLNPQGGRTLPLTAFVTREGEVLSLVQRSMLFDTELSPMAEALLGGVTIPQQPQKDQPDPASGNKTRWARVGEWAREPGNSLDGALYLAIQSGWQKGLTEQGFTELDMPFEKGSLKISPATGTTPEIVLTGEWNSTSGCSLTVAYNPDGSVAGTSGVCNTGG